MIINKETAEKIFDEILETGKLISKLAFTKDDFVNWIHTMNTINGIPYRTRMLNGELLSDFMIADDFNELIVASRYTLEEGDDAHDFKSSRYLEYKDSLELYGMEKATTLDSIKFSMMSRVICASRRYNTPNTKDVESLRVPKLVSSVENKLTQVIEGDKDKDGNLTSINTYCQPNNNKFVPIMLQILKYIPELYTIDCDDDIKKWWVQKLDGLGQNKTAV